ncbi:MAG: DUF2281 domain-containing protein [Acidobacteriota bacterium]
MQEETLIQKIRQLPMDKISEVEDFVDFLSQREQTHRITQAAGKLAEEPFRKIWDNEADAAYDRL